MNKNKRKQQSQNYIPCPSCESRENGWTSSFSMSVDDFLCLFLIIKKTATAPTAETDMTIPATPLLSIPDFSFLSLLPPPLEGLPLPPDLWFGGVVPGGGGGAGPELPVLLLDFLQSYHKSRIEYKVIIYQWWTIINNVLKHSLQYPF